MPASNHSPSQARADWPAGDPTELAAELAAELHSSNRAWVGWVRQRLELGGDGDGLEQEAAAALAAGDWRRGALLYRALLRPDPVADHRASGHLPKTPGSC